MLDTDTKRRIDSCRDILVGKVPDPKSQVEQITIALIYKFMDDMDAEAEELGGARSFFAGDYAKYGWAKLMSPSMGGFDVLALYSEAIGKMNENPGVPPLFRDIFKNAYLPYRDPETLRSFLKEINGFTYDHSERLGDAFEYLLSVLGSQGDAGQFRTPRHIIDFMVEIIDPKKNESILDPACGTAGFLISAWKHILKKNTKERSGDLLTPDERQHLAANIHGYDISPDMVRLSLVNLYLHGFTDPHIVEYDALTSEEKWNETADIILANPPFMSPKGGIKPHKRFSVQATRSEVLFVDYMAEHLSPQGRAAIVVPEGVIFQSGTAYKKLREMLVKNSLVAVVSLPAGVFNPYSGVKTSILILDKRLAKTAYSVLFVKVENDGYNLGAQRRAVTGSGLPDAAAAYRAFRHSRESGNPDAFDPAQFANAYAVEKTRIGENGEWNLSGERYRSAVIQNSDWPMVSVSEVCTIQRGLSYSSQELGDEGSGIPLYNLKSIKRNGATQKNDFKYFTGEVKERHYVQSGDLLVALTDLTPTSELIGSPKFVTDSLRAAYSADLGKLIFKDSKIIPQFLYYLLRSDCYRSYILMYSHGANVKHLQVDGFHSFQIPLPPPAIQQEIVTEIEGYQKIIDGARQVVENYRPHIAVQPDWPIVRFESLCEIVRGSSPRPQGDPRYFQGPVPRLMVADLTRDGMRVTPQIDSLTEEGAAKSRPMKAGSVVMAVSGNPGLPAILNVDACVHDGFVGFRLLDTSQISAEFLYYVLLWKKEAHGLQSFGAVFKNLTTDQIREFLIPLPDHETQRAIVAEIEAEQALVNANRQLIARFEAKIKAAINRVWGESEAASSSRAAQPEEVVDQAGGASNAPCAMSLAS
ncbi:MAG: N-6 DNA methylase [Sulfuricella sp.]